MGLTRFITSINYFPKVLKDRSAPLGISRFGTWLYLAISISSSIYIFLSIRDSYQTSQRYGSHSSDIHPIAAFKVGDWELAESRFGPVVVEDTKRLLGMYTNAHSWEDSTLRNNFLEPSINVGVVSGLEDSQEANQALEAFGEKMQVFQTYGGFQRCTRSALPPELGKYAMVEVDISSDFKTMTSNISKTYNAADSPGEEYFVPPGECSRDDPCVEEWNVKMKSGVKISFKGYDESAEEDDPDIAMVSVPGLIGDYAEVKLCGQSHSEANFLEYDYVKVMIPEDDLTSAHDATFFVKLATHKTFNTCPGTGDCKDSSFNYQDSKYRPKMSDDFLVTVKPKEVKVVDFDLIINTEEVLELWDEEKTNLENPIYGAGYTLKKVAESTHSSEADAPLGGFFRKTKAGAPQPQDYNMRALYVRINNIKYTRTFEQAFPLIDTLAELGGWTSAVFGCVNIFVSILERIDKRRRKKRNLGGGRREGVELSKAKKKFKRSDSEFEGENLHARKGNISSV